MSTKTVSPIPDTLRLQEKLRTLGDQLYESMCNKFGAHKVSDAVFIAPMTLPSLSKNEMGV